MANVISMPRQGQSVESCIITTWHKKKGDHVEVGDILFSYETDKSAFDEPSQAAGTVLAVLAEEGDIVPCLDAVCIIGEEGEDISALLKTDDKAENTNVTETGAEAPKAEAENDTAEEPAARSTGPHGRIIERDINKALDAGFVSTTAAVEDFLAGKVTVEEAHEETAVVAAVSQPEAAVVETIIDDFRAYEEEPLSNIRKVIARAMHSSLSEMAQLTLNSSFDATNLLAYRAKLKENGEALGLSKITINDMVLFAVARILPKYPEINANLVGETFRKYKHANVGMAVDTERGLLVPVIFGAEKLSLSDISAQAKVLAGKAREGKCSPDEMSGGSFTVSNLGSMGVESFTPVINPPQTAILGVCCTTNRLKADGKVYPAMGLSLTFDHRAVDGAPAAKFLKELCTALENFDLLLAK